MYVLKSVANYGILNAAILPVRYLPKFTDYRFIVFIKSTKYTQFLNNFYKIQANQATHSHIHNTLTQQQQSEVKLGLKTSP